MTLTTILGRSYVVRSSTTCTITTPEGETILRVIANTPNYFTATSKSVVCSNDDAVILPNFSKAPVSQAASGGGDGSSVDLTGYATETYVDDAVSSATSGQSYLTGEFVSGNDIDLLDSVVRDLGLINDITITGFSITAVDDRVATAELWLTTGDTAPSITWPADAVWLDGTSTGSAPSLEADTNYRFALREEPNGRIIMNLAYSYPVNI